MIRAALYAASLALVVTAALLVPMPLVETAPGTATSIPPLIEIDDADTTDIDGDLALLTVFLRQPTLYETLQAWASPVREIDALEQVFPPGVDRDEYFRVQRRQFTRSFDIAAAVGVDAAGREVDLGTAAYVAQVLPGGPSDGTLEPGDRFVTVEGERLDTSEELLDVVVGARSGDELEVTVERGERTLGLTVTAGQVAGMEQPGLGVLVETVANDIELPFAVEMSRKTTIGGPSAGLMIALTVYDLLDEENLVAGRQIVGTGTISAEGRVGRIGGIEEKVEAAEQAGATLMLVPADQLTRAQSVADDLEVVGVATLDEALAALRS